MSARRRQQWSVGDFFSVELSDGSYGIGQVIDLPLPNAASCAFFENRVDALTPPTSSECTRENVVGSAMVIPAHLDEGEWKVISRGAIVLDQLDWPNEETRGKRWVGAKIYTGAILEDFLNAFHALIPWDQFHDPHYLDKILISPSKKPTGLIYKQKR